MSPQWWNEPIVYQKVDPVDGAAGDHRRRRLVGAAGGQDQADDGRHPLLGAARNDPAAALAGEVPFTAGDGRTWFDVALYLALLVSVIVALVLPACHAALSAALPDNTSGLVNPALLIAPIVLLVVIGLRDKTIFLAARGEQYLPALFFFTFCRSST